MSLMLCVVASVTDSAEIVLGDKGDRGSAVEEGDVGPTAERTLLRDGGDDV